MKLRPLIRVVRVVWHVLSGLWTIRQQFGSLTTAQRLLLVQAWSQRLLQHLGIALEVRGQLPVSGPLLVLANHMSWLDIMVMNAAFPARFVSKSDVKHWPLIGALITGGGTLYIERESRRDAMRVVHHMADALGAGDVLAVFPEGTTGDGRELLPFHANLLQAAIAARAPVQPVALAFVDAASGQRSDAPVYVGNTTLLASIWRTLSTPGVVAVVTYGAIEHANGRDRRTWAADLRQTIQQLLKQVPSEAAPPTRANGENPP